MFYDLLLAERTGSLVQQPPLYAINVIIVLARQLADFFAFADIVVTNRAHLFRTFSLCFDDFVKLFFGYSFGHFANFFLQLKQFFIGHVVRVYFDPILIAHVQSHAPKVLHVHHSKLFI